jgi:hypothetical protein
MRKSKTIKDAYKDYAVENNAIKGIDKYFNIDYQTYRQVCLSFNKKVSDEILTSAFEFKMPSTIGRVRIKKLKASNTQRRVDWDTTKKNNVKVYHLNFHTDENYYKWFWHKQKHIFKNKSAYSFIPTRNNKRTLARLLKENKVEFFN